MTLNTPAPAPSPAPILVSLGQIVANEHWVTTPAGSWELKDVSVTTYDQTTVSTRIPTWAIVMVIVFIWFFLLSLLFLLAKEDRLTGYVSVVISTMNGQTYTEHVPINNSAARHDVFARVSYLQSLIGHARSRG